MKPEKRHYRIEHLRDRMYRVHITRGRGGKDEIAVTLFGKSHGDIVRRLWTLNGFLCLNETAQQG